MNIKQVLRAAFTAAFLLVSIQKIQANWFTGWFSSSTETRDELTQETIDTLKGVDITPQNTVFVFDMHGVVIKFSFWKGWKPLWYLPKKIHFLKKATKYFSKENRNPKRSFEGLVLENSDSTGYLTDATYITALIPLINPHIPIDGTTEIIKHLKKDDDKGFEIFGCSNIGERSYPHMQKMYPKAFDHFTACHTTKQTSNYEKKKSTAKAYTETVDMIESNMGDDAFAQVEHIIFVDNKMSNLERAKTADARFKGIFFTSPEQFQRDLEEIGLVF